MHIRKLMKTVHVSKCGRMTELKSSMNVRENVPCQDVNVKPFVRDPMDDDRVLVESGTEMTPVPHEPSEFEKQKHNLISHPIATMVHIVRQRQRHKRNHTSEQSAFIEDSELPVIQCDYLILKDVAGTGGLTVAQHVCENIRIRHVHNRLKRKAQQTRSQQCGQ